MILFTTLFFLLCSTFLIFFHLKRQKKGDTLRMTGRDLIRRAVRAGNDRVREKRDLLIEALRELVKSCESLQRTNPDSHLVHIIINVCEEFCGDQLSYYDGALKN